MIAKKKGRTEKYGPPMNREQLEAEMRRTPPPSEEELRYWRSAAAGPDADAEFGVSPRGRGRPRAGETAEGTVVRTIRRSPSFWARLASAAGVRGLTTHAAMVAALDEWVAHVEADRSRDASSRRIAARK